MSLRCSVWCANGIAVRSLSISEIGERSLSNRRAETTLVSIRVGRRHRAGRPRQKPLRVIADKGYDSDALRARLRRRGIL